MSDEHEDLNILFSVSYCCFDKAIGNVIDYTYPTAVKLETELESQSVVDYCFPDGAHDSYMDTVCMVLRLANRTRRRSSTFNGSMSASQTMAASTASSGSPNRTVDTASLEERQVYGFACYHLHKDASVHRGATQRSMLIIMRLPLFQLCRAVAESIIVPFFNLVNVLNVDTHREMVRRLHAGLHAALSVDYAILDASNAPCEKEDDEAMAPLRARGLTVASRVDPGSFSSMAVAKSQEHRRDADLLSMHHPVEVRVTLPAPPPIDPESDTPTNVTNESLTSSRELVRLEEELVVLGKCPILGAPAVDQMAHGASLKKLLQWFGDKATVIHWCLLCRMPVLFLGTTAAEVSEAVCASIHLVRPLDVDASRFVPYGTIEHIDAFIASVSSSVHLAIGATNAYVTHRDFPGVVKANINAGTVSFHNSKEPSIPKKHLAAFDDVVQAAKDPNVRECYFRARIERFNRTVAHQVRIQRSGYYYEALCRRANLIDAPLGDADDEIHTVEDSDGFIVVDDDSEPNPSEPPTPSVEEPNATPLSSAAGSPGAIQPPPDSNEASPQMPAIPQQSPGGTETGGLERLSHAIALFEDSAKKNHKIHKDLHKWYKFIYKYLVVEVLPESGPQQVQLFDEVKSFAPKPVKEEDDSLDSCASDIVSALTFQQQIDRNTRLRLGVEYKERVFMLIDSLCRHNPTALMRTNNRYFSDFFSFPNCRQYDMAHQVLLFSTACTTTLYVNRINIKTAGTVYVSRNYICFEAGLLSIRKRHQIFPFDVVRNVVRDTSSVFSAAVKVMMEFPDGSTCMMVISNPASGSGLYELLHVLMQKQRRLHKLMRGVPPVHAIPQGVPLTDMVCPRLIPRGLYTVREMELWDELWENQRQYPLVGWSDKMLPTGDPKKWSDFSGVKHLTKDTVPLPDGFRWTSDWTLACYVDDMTSDKLMVSSSASENAGEFAFDRNADEKERREKTSPQQSKGKDDVGFLYATHWTSTSFKPKPFVGCVVRRRLWIRRRALVAPTSNAPTTPLQAGSVAKVSNLRDEDPELSTDDEDIIAEGGERAIEAPMRQEDNTKPPAEESSS